VPPGRIPTSSAAGANVGAHRTVKGGASSRLSTAHAHHFAAGFNDNDESWALGMVGADSLATPLGC